MSRYHYSNKPIDFGDDPRITIHIQDFFSGNFYHWIGPTAASAALAEVPGLRVLQIYHA